MAAASHADAFARMTAARLLSAAAACPNQPGVPGQVRQLADAERAELEKQVAGFDARLAADAGDREALRGGGAAALALGNAPRAAELLSRLTDAAPGDAQAWQLLVRGAGLKFIVWEFNVTLNRHVFGQITGYGPARCVADLCSARQCGGLAAAGAGRLECGRSTLHVTSQSAPVHQLPTCSQARAVGDDQSVSATYWEAVSCPTPAFCSYNSHCLGHASFAMQAEARAAAADWKGAAAAYERARAALPAPDLDVLQGLAGALVADAQPQRAVEVRARLRSMTRAPKL